MYAHPILSHQKHLYKDVHINTTACTNYYLQMLKSDINGMQIKCQRTYFTEILTDIFCSRRHHTAPTHEDALSTS